MANNRGALVMWSLVIFWVIVLCIIGAGVAMAQGTGGPDSSQEVGNTSCADLAVKALRGAVDPARVDWQEWNLKAAQAYRQLADLGQSC